MQRPRTCVQTDLFGLARSAPTCCRASAAVHLCTDRPLLCRLRVVQEIDQPELALSAMHCASGALFGLLVCMSLLPGLSSLTAGHKQNCEVCFWEAAHQAAQRLASLRCISVRSGCHLVTDKNRLDAFGNLWWLEDNLHSCQALQCCITAGHTQIGRPCHHPCLHVCFKPPEHVTAVGDGIISLRMCRQHTCSDTADW